MAGKKVDGSFDGATVRLIVKRDRSRCALCGRLVRGERGRGWSVHHRRPRGQGGTSLAWVGMAANGVLLCGSGTTACHGAIERSRGRALETGFLISRIGVQTAMNTVIRHAVHGLVLLDNEGGWSPAEGFGDEWSKTVEGNAWA